MMIRWLPLLLRAVMVAVLLLAARELAPMHQALVALAAGVIAADYFIMCDLKRDVRVAIDQRDALHEGAKYAVAAVVKLSEDAQAEAAHFRRLYLKKVSER